MPTKNFFRWRSRETGITKKWKNGGHVSPSLVEQILGRKQGTPAQPREGGLHTPRTSNVSGFSRKSQPPIVVRSNLSPSEAMRRALETTFGAIGD